LKNGDKMKGDEIKNKVDIIKDHLEELYEEGVIKAQLYNDLYTKVSEIKYHIECEK